LDQILIKIKKYKSILFIAIIAVAAIWFYRFNPAEDELFLKCPFKTVTGWDCPGCGSQRAIHELLHLNFGKAFYYNPLMVSLIPYVMLGFAFEIDSVKNRFPKTRKFLFGTKAIFILLIVIIVFFVMRNIY